MRASTTLALVLTVVQLSSSYSRAAATSTSRLLDNRVTNAAQNGNHSARQPNSDSGFDSTSVSNRQMGKTEGDESKSYGDKNAYDDRMGWVTLEPIAWSASQVQKWQPNDKHQWAPPANNWPNNPGGYGPASSASYAERPWKRPTYQYQPVQQSKPWPSANPSASGYFSSAPAHSDIVTDGQPGYFPSGKPTQQQQYNPWTDAHAPTETADRGPSNANGHWVLLSSTKGYSIPRESSNSRSDSSEPMAQSRTGRRLAFGGSRGSTVQPRSIKLQRSVRLRVLPSLNGTSNTVTSHGGLIEVEKSHQTVDQSHREHLARKMNLAVEKYPTAREYAKGKRSVVSARARAVSSNVIPPATMAMLIPMLLARKNRQHSKLSTPAYYY